MKIFKKTKIIFIALLALFFVFPVFAQVNLDPGLGVTLGLVTDDVESIVIKIVNAALGFLAIIAITFILYGGFKWMTSGGAPEMVNDAKKILTSALIGLAIVLLSFAIVQFIFRGIYGGGGVTGPGGAGGGGGALGRGIIESVYPVPGARDVARNTGIIVTFKEEIDPTTIIDDTNGTTVLGDWNDQNGDGIMDNGEYDVIASGATPYVEITKQSDFGSGPYVTDVFVTKTPDNKTFIFKPVDPLGSSVEKVWYTVNLTNDIEKAGGDPAFGAFGGFYWSFEIGTYLDVTPPYVVSARPIVGGTYDRNIVIQVVFSEAINPVSATVDNVVVEDSSSSPVSGSLYIANQYKTVEFLGVNCGTNSCNETIYCLPGNETITVTVNGADCDGVGGCPEALPPFDGIVDMAWNSLDGDNDGSSEGVDDDYSWSFDTTGDINLNPPTITDVSPGVLEDGVTLTDPIEVLFSDIMMHSTLTTDNLKIISPSIGHWTGATNIGGPAPHTRADIFHYKFSTATQYKTEVTSGVKNEYQNCFYPSSDGSCTGIPYCCNGVGSATPCP